MNRELPKSEVDIFSDGVVRHRSRLALDLPPNALKWLAPESVVVRRSVKIDMSATYLARHLAVGNEAQDQPSAPDGRHESE